MQNEIILRLCALVCVKGDIALKRAHTMFLTNLGIVSHYVFELVQTPS